MSAQFASYMYGFAIPRPSMGIPNDEWERSEKFMIEDLAKSGLVPTDLLAYPVMLNLPRLADAGYVLPYFGLDGKPLAETTTGITNKMHRMRLRYPDNVGRSEKDKCSKYKGAMTEVVGGVMATAPYVPPSWWSGSKEIRFICEGEKKALALAKRFKVGAMGIGGCDNWTYTPPGGIREIHPWFKDLMAGVQRVIIVPDGDIRRPNINRAYRGLARALGDMGVEVEIINFSLMKPDKVDDWLVANPDVGVDVLASWERFDITRMTEDRRHLIREYNLHVEGQNESIVPNESNFAKLLEGYPVFKGQIKLNTDKHRVEYLGTPPDYDMEGETLLYFQDIFGITKAKTGTVRNALSVVASRAAYSPLAEWLMSLEWDGEDRLDQWMVDYLGADDSEYTREIGRKSLIGAVARRLRAGCAVDYMTILKGPQGIGKSGAIKMLFGEGETLEYMRGVSEGKDALQQNAHIWCHSDEELGNLTNSDRNRLKAQITIRADTFRAPYDRAEKVHPRRYVMWGSTNDEGFLPDDGSGQRRYAVVEMVGPVDWKGLAEVRDQLWAEAVAMFLHNDIDFSNILGASEASEKYVIKSVVGEQVDDAVAQFFKDGVGKHQITSHNGVNKHWFKLSTLLTLLGYQTAPPTSIQIAVATALKKDGWVKVEQMRMGGERVKNVWTRSVPP